MSDSPQNKCQSLEPFWKSKDFPENFIIVLTSKIRWVKKKVLCWILVKSTWLGIVSVWRQYVPLPYLGFCHECYWFSPKDLFIQCSKSVSWAEATERNGRYPPFHLSVETNRSKAFSRKENGDVEKSTRRCTERLILQEENELTVVSRGVRKSYH